MLLQKRQKKKKKKKNRKKRRSLGKPDGPPPPPLPFLVFDFVVFDVLYHWQFYFLRGGQGR